MRLSGFGIICVATGRESGERSAPLVSQWATVFQLDSCDDETIGGLAGLAGGLKLVGS